ncbi:MAG: TraB/GumN family protein [Gilvibacter sp.]
MKKLYALLVLPMLLGLSCNSQQKPLEKSLLWEISGNGLAAPSYLYGTFHAVCDATLPKKVRTALDKTDVVVLEVDMDDLNLASLGTDFMFMKDKTYQDFLTDEQYAQLQNYFKENSGIEITQLGNVVPFYLSVATIPSWLNCDMQSIDQSVMSSALYNDMEVLGLESIESQYGIFQTIPYQDQIDDLMQQVALGWDDYIEKSDRMLATYRAEDIEQLYDDIAYDESLLTTKHLDLFLFDRNRAWIPNIKSIAHKQAALFAVGAGHLAGDQGVINLLREQGYTVSPVFE